MPINAAIDIIIMAIGPVNAASTPLNPPTRATNPDTAVPILVNTPLNLVPTALNNNGMFDIVVPALVANVDMFALAADNIPGSLASSFDIPGAI